jgi:hypothetical protein
MDTAVEWRFVGRKPEAVGGQERQHPLDVI